MDLWVDDQNATGEQSDIRVVCVVLGMDKEDNMDMIGLCFLATGHQWPLLKNRCLLWDATSFLLRERSRHSPYLRPSFTTRSKDKLRISFHRNSRDKIFHISIIWEILRHEHYDKTLVWKATNVFFLGFSLKKRVVFNELDIYGFFSHNTF